MNFLKSKTFEYILLITLVLLTMGMLYKMKPDYMFSADSLIKLIQARAVLDNNFLSENVSCQWLAEFKNCEFIINGFSSLNGKLLGPFPVTQAYLNAFLLKILPASSILWTSLVFFWSGILFLYYSWNLRKTTLFLSLFATTLFFHSITFQDVAICFTLVSLGFFYLSKEEPGNSAYFLSGLSLGSTIFFRPEVIILGVFLLLFSWIYKRNNKLFILAIGLAIPILTFFLLNLALYDNILGTRILSNKEGFYNFGMARLKILMSLLFYGEMRYGLFGYMPFLLFLYLFAGFHNRKYSLGNLEKILLFSSILPCILLAILSPNNSNIDWGSRYLTMTLLPAILLADKLYASLSDKPKKIFLIGLIICSLYSIKLSNEYYKNIVKISKESETVYKFYKESEGDIWIFSNHLLINSIGAAYLEKPVLYIRAEDQIPVMIDSINQNSKIQKITFIQFNPIFSSIKYSELQDVYLGNQNLDAILKNKLSETYEQKSKNSLQLIDITIFQKK